MIQIDRTRIPPPFELLKAAEAEADRAIDYYLDPNNLRYGKPFPHGAYRMPEVREALNELFHGKCAFCESRLDDLEPGEFRPRDMAVNYDGAVTKPGYWWLAWEWSNLYPICPLCNRTKADRFPVEGPRATFERPGSPKQMGERWADPLNIQAMAANDQLLYLVTRFGSADSLLVWDIETSKIRSETGIPFPNPTFISITPDGRDVAIASEEGQIILWNFTPRYYVKEAIHIEVGQPVQAIGLAPDGKQLVAATPENLVSYDIAHPYNITYHEEMTLAHGHSETVTSLSVSQDGLFMVTASKDETVKIWSLKSLRQLRPMQDLSIEAFTSHFTILEKSDLEIGAALIRTLEGHESPVVGARIAGNKVVSLSLKGSLRVWDLESGENVFTLAGDGSACQSLDLSADGRYAVCKTPSTVRVVDLHTRRERARIEFSDPQPAMAAVTPNGKYIFTADQRLKTWHLDPVGGERALLLDPCLDQPADILIFSEDGEVADGLVARHASKGSAGVREGSSQLSRGQLTIDTFGLNRYELVAARKDTANQLRNEVKQILESSQSADFNRLLDPSLPFTALRRQLLPKYIQEFTQEFEALQPQPVPFDFEQQIKQYAVQGDVFEKAFQGLEELKAVRLETSVQKGIEARDFFKRSAYISKIVIENYRCIHELEFDFKGGSEKQASWKVLLGENGVGKSSVLEAVALALLDRERLEKIPEIKKGSLLKHGARKGCVQIYFPTENLPVEIELTPAGPVPKSLDSGLHTYLLGFGSARWLPGEGSQPPETDPYIRVRNLFNPFVPLTNAIDWLKELKAARAIKKYQKVELVLTRLLQLEPGTRFPLRDDTIYVKTPGKSIADSERLDEMSDGYQTILAIAITIMDMLGELWDMEMEAAEGLVLLDEIGAHLHPRWKMKIVDSLRSAFPRMQFLATTHEPLCLRGLYDNEILLLRKIEGRVKADPIEESPDTLTTDQLLRSPLFGLMTTFDPDTDHELERYAYILSIPETSRSEDEKSELDRLRERLAKKGVLAEMARKQVVHGMLADSIPKPAAFDPETASPKTKVILKELVAETDLNLDI